MQVQSLVRALAILNRLGASDEGLKLIEIGQVMEVTPLAAKVETAMPEIKATAKATRRVLRITFTSRFFLLLRMYVGNLGWICWGSV